MKKIFNFLIISLLISTILTAKDIFIDQKDKTFIPTRVTAYVGDNIVFKNSDGFAHNAFSDNKENKFDIGMQRPSEKISVKMKAVGIVDVECAIHPNMHLEIIVKDKIDKDK